MLVQGMPLEVELYEEEQREIEAMRVWPTLRGNLWHATSIGKSAGILSEGAIRIGDTSTYKNSYCHKLGYVSLFDFTEPLEQIASQYMNWQGWFGYQSHIEGKATVWFQIDRDAVQHAVKTVKESYAEWAANGHAQYIPFVEVGHRGPLLVSAVTGALVISRQDRSRFQMVEPGPDWQARIQSYAATLPELPPPSALELALIEANRKARERIG